MSGQTKAQTQMLLIQWEEYEKICQKEWDKLHKSWCESLLKTYPRGFKAIVAAEGASSIHS